MTLFRFVTTEGLDVMYDADQIIAESELSCDIEA
jgi:hypothetical protein